MVAMLLAVCLVVFLGACQAPPSRDAADYSTPGPNEFPLHYTLGSFDRRFGITQERFLEIAEDAKAVWEKSAGRSFFVYDSAADFRLNLIYDQRQERTDDAKRAKSKIDSRGKSYDLLVWQHGKMTGRVTDAQERYQADAAAYERTMNEFNERITQWNEAGGAPAAESEKLSMERRRLEERGSELERRRVSINDDVSAINDITAEINTLVAENHLEVTLYNGKFVEGREFEQGVYDGQSINIYQFTGPIELRMALIHEFGHALGFGHVDDPAAIMFYRFEQQDLDNVHLTEADLALIRKKLSTDWKPAG